MCVEVKQLQYLINSHIKIRRRIHHFILSYLCQTTKYSPNKNLENRHERIICENSSEKKFRVLALKGLYHEFSSILFEMFCATPNLQSDLNYHRKVIFKRRPQLDVVFCSNAAPLVSRQSCRVHARYLLFEREERQEKGEAGRILPLFACKDNFFIVVKHTLYTEYKLQKCCTFTLTN
jgi:hypothetical protein